MLIPLSWREANTANITIEYKYSQKKDYLSNVLIINSPEDISIVGESGILLNSKDVCNMSIVLINMLATPHLNQLLLIHFYNELQYM